MLAVRKEVEWKSNLKTKHIAARNDEDKGDEDKGQRTETKVLSLLGS